jgi:hypothetical protein
VVRAPDEFASKNIATAKRHSRCRICCRERSRRHYHQQRAAYIARNRRNAPRLRELAKLHVYRFLLGHPCVACGEADPVVLEFNHRNPATKTANMSDLTRTMASAERIDAEIAKCDVLCANCHQWRTTLARAVHYKLARPASERSRAANPREAANFRNARLVWDRLAQGPCIDCGEGDPLVLQFDHRDGKSYDISRLVGNGCPPGRLADELTKCDVRCANCHRRRTAQVNGWFRTRARQSTTQIVDELTDVYRAR